MKKLMMAAVCSAAAIAFGEIEQTGATQTNVGADDLYTWTSNGSVTIPDDGLLVDLLVVGGGGGGGGQGGGGGGGVAYYQKVQLQAGAYAVTIGAGGSNAGDAFAAGSTGGSSKFGNLYTVLGGSGGGGWSNAPKSNGANGAGGSTMEVSNVSDPTQIPSGKSGMKGTVGVAAEGQVGTGHTGGNATNNGSGTTGNGGGGGGAGAGADGQHSQVFTVASNNDATAGEHAGNGGDGYLCAITGEDAYYGGGGGGGVRRSNYKLGGIGGQGGGGNGGGGTPETGAVYAGTAGTDGLGGGGGAAGWDKDGKSKAAGVGGSGVVILRVLKSNDVEISADATSISFTCHVRDLGDADAADVLFAIAPEGSELPALETKKSGAVKDEAVSFAVDGLTTGATYAYKVVYLKSGTQDEIFVMEGTAQPFPVLEPLTTTVWVSGLKQAKFNASYDKTKGLSDSVISVEAVPGPVMADVKTDESTYSSKGYANPYTGTSYYYNKQNTTFAYFGYIWLEAGVQYNFAKNIDDSGYVKIGETVVLDNGTYNSYPVVNFKPEESGWYVVDMRCGDGNGGKGPSGGKIGSAMGLGYNKDGVTTQQATGWDYVRDPNDLSFLRTEDSSVSSMMALSELTTSGDDIVFFASFENVPGAAELRAYYDVADKGDTPSLWGNYIKVADIPAGTTPTASYTAVGAANSYVRLALVVSGTDTVQGRYQFSPVSVFSGDKPIVSITVDDVGYTGASVTVDVAALGGDSTSATATVLVSTSEDMSATREIALDSAFTAPGVREVELTGLVSNTTYYVCVAAENDNGHSVTSSASAFTTLLPTAPEGTVILKSNGAASQTFIVTVTDLGDGSDSATVTMQCATDAGFTEGLRESDPVVVAESDLGIAKDIAVSGLQKNTDYYTRLKIVNTWGFVYYTEAEPYTTFDSVVVQGVGYASVEGGFNVDVVVSYMEGDSVTVELFANGVSVGTKTLTEAGAASFEVASASDLTVLRAVVTGAVTVEKTASAKKGTTSIFVGDPAEHASSATAIKLHIGDSVSLPALIGNMSYKVLNHSFLLQDGNVFTAIKPGIVGVECYDAGGALATTMAVVVIPEAKDPGRIFIWNETKKSSTWCAASTWLALDGSEAADYPHLADDVAIFPLYTQNNPTLNLGEDVTVGQILFGYAKDASTAGLKIQSADSTTVRTMTFRRTDAGKCLLQACGNCQTNDSSGNARRQTLTFGGNATRFVCMSDTEFDGGWDGIDAKYATARPSYASNSPLVINSGVTYSLRNIDTTGTDASCTFAAPKLEGEGVFWNRSGANVRFESSRQSDSFTGVIRDSAHGNQHIWRSGPSNFYSAAVTNASVEAYGFVANSSGSPGANTSGVGMFCTGHDHSHANPGAHPWINWLPARGMTLVNSTYFCGSTELGYGVGVAEYKYTATTTVGRGFSFVYRNSNRDNKSGNPINWFETDELVHQDKGTIRIDDYYRSKYADPADTTNNVTILHGFKSLAVGGNGDPKASENYPIIPWMVTPSKNTDSEKLAFTCVDGNDRICDMATRTNRALDEVVDENENAYVKDKSVALTSDRTMNTLWLYNANKEKKLGAEKTLTIASGGLILRADNSAIGTKDGGEANGALVLGDEASPGYVFADATDASKPGAIYAKVTAPGGLVFGYTGYALLAGDQTGIDDELVVNAGTLDLGSQDKTVACTLDVPVRILANATVKANNVSMDSSAVYFDDIAGYGGKMELNAAETRCQKLFVRDTPEETEWTALPSGTYGASGSGAEFIDDDRFTGPGQLIVSGSASDLGVIVIVM